MGPGAVDRDAEELSSMPLELGHDLLVQPQLVGAHRAPVGRIEHQDQGPAAELRWTDRPLQRGGEREVGRRGARRQRGDRKSTRLNSSHITISYAVFCLKKKK